MLNLDPFKICWFVIKYIAWFSDVNIEDNENINHVINFYKTPKIHKFILDTSCKVVWDNEVKKVSLINTDSILFLDNTLYWDKIWREEYGDWPPIMGNGAVSDWMSEWWHSPMRIFR